MSIVREVCPSCAAPLSIPPDATRFKCPYCSTPLAVQRHGSEVMLTASERLAATLEKTGSQTHEVIKEGTYVTQAELRRLQVAQDLSMVQMRLSNVQSEIRAIERMPLSSLTRNQLRELRAQEADLKQQVQTLANILNPPQTVTVPVTPSKPPTAGLGNRTELRNLLFSKQGRISRTQYWVGMLIVGIVFFFASAFSGAAVETAATDSESSMVMCGGFLLLLSLWMFYAVSAKRYHDHGKSSLWVLIAFIPLVQLWQLIELGFLPGTPGPNKYG